MRRELGVDHVVGVVARSSLAGAGRLTGGAGAGPALGGRAQGLGHLVQLAREGPQAVDRCLLVEGRARVVDQHLGPGAVVLGDRVPGLLELALHLVGHGVELVAGVDELTELGVLAAVRLGVRDHAVDLLLAQGRGLADGDLLLGTGVLVLGGDVQDAVGVDVEGDLDLGLPSRRGPDVLQPEPRERPVVAGALPLALEDHHVHRLLVVLGGAEDLGATRRDRGVALDDLGHHPALRLQPQRERCDVQEQDVLHVALDDRRLHGRAECDDLVRVDGHVGFLATGHPANQVLHRGDARGTADEDDLVDVVRGDLRVPHGLLDRTHAAFDEVRGELLERGAHQVDVEVLGAGSVRGHERKVHRCLGDGRQLDLGLLGRLEQALQGLRVLP